MYYIENLEQLLDFGFRHEYKNCYVWDSKNHFSLIVNPTGGNYPKDTLLVSYLNENAEETNDLEAGIKYFLIEELNGEIIDKIIELKINNVIKGGD